MTDVQNDSAIKNALRFSWGVKNGLMSAGIVIRNQLVSKRSFGGLKKQQGSSFHGGSVALSHHEGISGSFPRCHATPDLASLEA